MIDLLLVVIILAPAVLAYWLKSNSAISYLAASAGFVLLSLTSTDLQKLLDHSDIVQVSPDVVGLLLFILPPLLTLLATKDSVRGKYMRIFHIVPSLCLGGLMALIAVPLMSDTTQSSFTNSALWTQLQDLQPWIIGVGALTALLLIWSDHLKPPKKKK